MNASNRRSQSRAAADSVIERLSNAIDQLTTGPGDARSRLKTAGMILTPLRTHEFPPEVQADYAWIWAQLTRFPSSYDQESTIESTMRQIRNSTASKIAKRLLDVYRKVQKIRGHQGPLE